MLRTLGICAIGIAVLAVAGASAASLRVDGGVLQVFAFQADIEVPNPPGPITAPIDIRPGSCPNPLNVNAGGMVSVAIVGTADLEVADVDPATVTLEGVVPEQTSFEDVATPYTGGISGPPQAGDCTAAGADGIQDLVLHFDDQKLVAALGTVDDGDVLVLVLAGEMTDGTPITGKDVVVIHQPGGGRPGNQSTTTNDDDEEDLSSFSTAEELTPGQTGDGGQQQDDEALEDNGTSGSGTDTLTGDSPDEEVHDDEGDPVDGNDGEEQGEPEDDVVDDHQADD